MNDMDDSRAKSFESFITAWGAPMVVNRYLIIVVAFLLISTITNAVTNVYLYMESLKVKPMVVLADVNTGKAVPIGFEVYNADGEKIPPAVIRRFCIDFIINLYTYNRYTIKTNLDMVLTQELCSEAVKNGVKLILKNEERWNKKEKGIQGLVTIKSVKIISMRPSLRVEVLFFKKEISTNSTLDRNDEFVGVFNLKTTKEITLNNPLGLHVVEYYEAPINAIKEKKNEKS